ERKNGRALRTGVEVVDSRRQEWSDERRYERDREHERDRGDRWERSEDPGRGEQHRDTCGDDGRELHTSRHSVREPRSGDRGHLDGKHDDAKRRERHPDANGIRLKKHVVDDQRHNEDRRVQHQQSADERTAGCDAYRRAEVLPVAERALTIVPVSWWLLHGEHERGRGEAPEDRKSTRL